MKKFFETKEFEKLNRQWEEKLDKDGFEDIETDRGRSTGEGFQQVISFDPVAYEYFGICEDYLNSGLITDKLDLFILTKHVEGLSNREIARILPENGFEQIDQSTVYRNLRKILNVAGIKPMRFRR